MRRQVASTAEIARRRYQCCPEDVRPDTVHPHAGRERILAACDRFGHFSAAAAVLERRRLGVLALDQTAEEVPLDLRAAIRGIASEKHDLAFELGGVGE